MPAVIPKCKSRLVAIPYMRKPKEARQAGRSLGLGPATSANFVETALQQHLRERYKASDWDLALKVVMDAKGDTEQAASAVETLMSITCKRSGLTIKLKLSKPPQLDELEQALKELVSILEDKKRIRTALSIDELLDPREEHEDADTVAESFENDAAIIAEVRRREAEWSGEAVDVESDVEGDSEPAMPISELIALAEKLEVGFVSRAGATISLDFLYQIRSFRAELHREQTKNARQTTLQNYGFAKSA